MVSEKTLFGILHNDPKVMQRFYRGRSVIDTFNRVRRQGYAEHWNLNLCGINLKNADLRGVNFESVHFYNAVLSGANFEGANLRGAHFDYSYADGTNFRNADLKGCSYLYKLEAEGADFENADLRGATFSKPHDWHMRRLLGAAHFSKTKISPEQKAQLVAEFEIPENFFEGRFVIVPRGRYHRGPDDYFSERALEAYETARKEGRICVEWFNRCALEYAVIPVRGNEDLHDRAGYAFSLCQTPGFLTALLGSQEANYRGKWLYFVFDSVPEKFREFAAVHEFGEKEGGSHGKATVMEYERARSSGMLNEYLSWIATEHPDKLMADSIYTFAKEGMTRLPHEVIEAINRVTPKGPRARKQKLEMKQHGLPFDIWKLAWKGLSSDEITEALARKGYDATASTVTYWKTEMEIPDCISIQKFAFLEPV